MLAGNSSRDTDIVLNYTIPQMQEGCARSTTSVPQTLLRNTVYDATDNLTKFQNGTLTLAPRASSANISDPNPNWQPLSFAVKSLSIAATINIIGGITGKFEQNPSTKGFTFEIKSTSKQMQNGKLTVTGSDGTKVEADIKFSKSKTTNDLFGSADLPAGLAITPTVSALDLVIEVDSASFEAYVGPSRANCRPLSESDLRALSTL